MSGFTPDHPGAIARPAPGFEARRDDAAINCLILHYTGMETGIAAEDRLCDASSGVSCHYLVHEDGRIVQMVREAQRAWHAGKSFWRGCRDINSCSVGIEIVNPGHAGGLPAYPDAQIEAVIALSQGICGRYPIPPERVLGHSDVAPDRKSDPGERFPWADLAARGIGHFVAPAPVGGGRFLSSGDRGEPVEALQSMLAIYGYDIAIDGAFDAAMEAVIVAFQRHFRPERVDGVADRSTIDTLHRLIGAVPSRRLFE